MWRKQRKFVTDVIQKEAEAPVNEEETQEMEEANVIQLESGEELIVPRSKSNATEEPNAKQKISYSTEEENCIENRSNEPPIGQ